MKQALHHHVRAGGRVYAEGGGLAYVSRALECRAGRFEMAGLLPAIAQRCDLPSEPVEFRMSQSNWLGAAGSLVRGYQNPCWQIRACEGLRDYCDDPQFRLNVVGHRRVIGSRLHLHFSSQPGMLQNLLRPRRRVDC